VRVGMCVGGGDGVGGVTRIGCVPCRVLCPWHMGCVLAARLSECGFERALGHNPGGKGYVTRLASWCGAVSRGVPWCPWCVCCTAPVLFSPVVCVLPMVLTS
jgi:hypothetical protein